MIRKEERAEEAATEVIGAAIEVHRILGPGYLEAVYEEALTVEFRLRGVGFQRQLRFPVGYKGQPIGEGWLDFLVESCLVVELKAVDALALVHASQVVSYLKGTSNQLGLLINFNVPTLKQGLKRIIL